MDEFNTFLGTMSQFWTELSLFLPRFMAVAVLVIAGWLFAKIVRKGAIHLFRIFRLDDLAEKSGIDDVLLRGGVQYTTSTLLANLLYWSMMFVVLLAIVNSLGVPGGAELFNKIIAYIPNVIIAIFILMFGILFGKFIRGLTLTYLNNVGISGAELVSIVAQWAILVFVVSLALEQLSIGGQILISAFQIAFGALCLALALAFGLGGREWAAHILEKMWKKPSASTHTGA